ncbi:MULTISPECIES: hypothetical protein [Bacillales]|uniref:Uncharacterized protein n=1 Tax=Anoxybacillus andreesenii TaxID=1325932 RepID=A0ABT9VAK3_9BACL|nr:hypothetical protein [Robertmurraya andreesenii]MDQ0157952.1 hypothetical protein [Robertmurraya andreesenii]
MEDWQIIKRYKDEYKLILYIGTDDPSVLALEKTLNEVAALAKRMGYPINMGIGDIRVISQNELAKREFRYEKIKEYLDYGDKDDMLIRKYPKPKN